MHKALLRPAGKAMPLKLGVGMQNNGAVAHCVDTHTHTHRVLPYIALLLEGVGQVTVGVREVGLQLDGAAVRVNGQVDKTLLVVDARQVAVDDGMVGAQAEGTQVASHRSEW